MRFLAVTLCYVLVSVQTSTAAGASKDSGATFPMKYEGGSLGLEAHAKLKTTVAADRITIMQGKQRQEIPVKSITEVSYGADVHRRVGAAIGVGIVTLGLGALMALVKTKKHYVGIVWADKPTASAATAGTEKKGGIVFKVGKGEYRGFVAALEGVTGLKAVNADAVGSGGTAKP